MKVFLIILGVLFAVGFLSQAMHSGDDPRHRPPTAAEIEAANTANEAAKQRELDLRAREKKERDDLKAKFAANRADIIKQAKTLQAQRKWDDLTTLGAKWALADDAELDGMYNTAHAKLNEIAQAAELAERKRQGVSIGMSKEEALMSSWGKPVSVNSTHTAYGTHEQRVYPGNHSYLYFENDKLTAIQN